MVRGLRKLREIDSCFRCSCSKYLVVLEYNKMNEVRGRRTFGDNI